MPLLQVRALGHIRLKYAHACTFFIWSIIGLLTGAETAKSQSIYTWRSDAANGSWADAANWIGGTPAGFDVLTFDNDARLLSTNNLTAAGTNRNRIVFGPGSGPRIILGGTANTLKSVGGALPLVENASGQKQVLSFPLALGGDAIITSSVPGELVFSNTIDLKTNALRVDAAGEVTLAGVTRSSGGVLTKAGPGTLTLSGSSNNVGLGGIVEEGTLVLAKTSGSGMYSVNGPVAVRGGTLRIGGTGGNQIPSGVSVVLAGGGFLDLGGRSESIDIVEGDGIITNSSLSQGLLTIGGPEPFTFRGTIVDGSSGGKLALTKVGSGTLSLEGTNSYSGVTIVSAGKLAVSTTGASHGAYTLGNGATLIVVRSTAGATLDIGDLKTTANGFLEFDLAGLDALPADPILTALNITPISGTTVDLRITGGICETGRFPVISYSGSYVSSGVSFSASTSLPSGVNASLIHDALAKTFYLNLTRITPRIWTGASGALWNTTHQNWRDTAGATYSETANGGCAVVFDDTLTSAHTNIQVEITASPIEIRVNCTNKDYSFFGAGRISGSPRLTKNGPGRLRFAISNDFRGDTLVNGGILEVANASALGSTARGTIVAPGATLQLSNISVIPEALVLSGQGFGFGGALRHTAGTSVWTGLITLTGNTARVAADAGMLRIASPIYGPASALLLGGPAEIILSNRIATASLTKDGAGLIRLLGSNSFTEAVEIGAGTVRLDGTNTGAASLSIGSGGALAGYGLHIGTVVVNGVISAGASVGNFRTGSQIWNQGGSYVADISAPIGTPGIDWDLLTINGGIEIKGQFVIKPVSRSGETQGSVSGFDNNSSYAWRIVELLDKATNFNSSLIEIDSSSFDNDLAGGKFVIETNGGLNLCFTNNHPPMAGNATFTRAPGTTMKIAISELLGSFTTDADADGRELVSFGATANGGTVQRDADWLLYTPPDDDADDSFTYTVRDSRDYRAGDTVRTATANISITKVRSAGTAQRIDATGGLVSITFAGIPGFVYDVERSSDLDGWSVVATIVNPETGVFSFVDPDPPAEAAYYRLRQH